MLYYTMRVALGEWEDDCKNEGRRRRRAMRQGAGGMRISSLSLPESRWKRVQRL